MSLLGDASDGSEDTVNRPAERRAEERRTEADQAENRADQTENGAGSEGERQSDAHEGAGGEPVDNLE
ncbi:hypothetical protein JD276_00780 [Leucobacter sp. CSA1]|uniref:Uncharacterized protein n=1 Tax=Leucobacter chromiisoli TaxID=2796471 RepID=A0A934UTW4_9MICO|nr:hypothetical protein [Leucobacter chromiisoli]MBK0417573.1 hypothetical protein [Leucobacter chromiisoli]